MGSTSVFRFAAFIVNPRAGEVRKHGLRIRLTGQPLEILVALLETPGELVTREDLRNRLWSNDTFVDFDNGLNAAINKLREALGDSADNPRYVETVPRRGYRFIAPVELLAATDAAANPPAPGQAVPAADEPDLVIADRAASPMPIVPPVILAQPRSRLLTRWFPVVAAILLVAAALLTYRTIWPKTSASQGRIMVAVLPFQDLSPAAAEDALANGLTEEMISQLGRLHPVELGVIARTSTQAYRNSSKNIAEIGRELNVDYVLEGTIRRADDRLRVSAQLVRISDQSQIWSDSIDRPLAGITSIQNEVVRRISRALALQLLPGHPAVLDRASTTNPEAYESYLRGREHWNRRTVHDNQRARHYFETALSLDPNYAQAHVGLADTFVVWHGQLLELSPDEAYPAARDSVLKALELDPSLAEAHATLATILWEFDWDWVRAEQEYRQALSLNPSYASAYQWYSEFLIAMGRSEEAMVQAKRALELDPRSPLMHTVYGITLCVNGRDAEAVTMMRTALQLDPNFLVAHHQLANAFESMKRPEDAMSHFLQASLIEGLSQEDIAAYHRAFESGGLPAVHRRTLERLKRSNSFRPVSPYVMAGAHAAVGDQDAVAHWLDRAFTARDPRISRMRAEFSSDRYKSDPRILSLIERVGFPSSAVVTRTKSPDAPAVSSAADKSND